MSKNTDIESHDPRPHVNVVFVGHVDAGKSTTCGNTLVLSGLVDPRTVERYEREAKEKNREGWYLAYIFDLTDEERSKGKTVEVGRAAFSLENTRFTILDAPGHKSFVPNMIAGAAQADIGVLIISARKGEFEAGFDRQGQTREHALLCKTLGVQHLIVAVNKMDEVTCNWNQKRFDEIQKSVGPYLKNIGFPPQMVTYVPIAGLSGSNLKEHVSDSSSSVFNPLASWYPSTEPTLFQLLDSSSKYLGSRDNDGPFRMPVVESYKDQGVIAIGKVERGSVVPGQKVVFVPGNRTCKVAAVLLAGKEDTEIEIPIARVGENIALRLEGINAEEIPVATVLCDQNDPIIPVTKIKAQIMIVDLVETRPLMTAGYSCICHSHALAVECTVTSLLDTIDKATKKKTIKPNYVKAGQLVTCIVEFNEPMALEDFEQSAVLGRFTLRDESKTIAIGKVLKTNSNTVNK